jgi:AraC-like DNA-binding protein
MVAASALRTQVVHHRSELGEWELVTRAPDPRLRPYVRTYVGTRSRIDLLRERHLPSGDAALLINFGTPHRLIDPESGRASEHDRAWVNGLHDHYLLTEAIGVRHFIVVRLTPIGAHRFLGVPMDALTNRTLALEDIIGAQAHRLVERLQAAASWDSCFAVLDSIILARLDRAAPAPAAVAWAWHQIDASAGSLAIASLTSEIGWSRKHLIEEFRRRVGLPPKPLARILRFHRVVRLLERSDAISWAALAHDCGYYDQPHFIRDFRAFAGSTPSQFLGRRLPDSASRVRD